MQRAREGRALFARNGRHSTEHARDCPKELSRKKAQEEERNILVADQRFIDYRGASHRGTNPAR
jgi:hypothetical protein